MRTAVRSYSWVVAPAAVGVAAGIVSQGLLERGKEDGAQGVVLAAPVFVAFVMLMYRVTSRRSGFPSGRAMIVGPLVALLVAALAWYVAYEAACPGVQDLC